MSGVVRLFDGLRNLVANLGTDRDKASASSYFLTPLSDHQLSDAYRSAWLPGKIIDIPAMDACRNWRGWQASQEEISALEAEENRLNLRAAVRSAMIKARLFGGAGIYIGTGDSDPSQPLDPRRIGRGGIRYLAVMTRRTLTSNGIENDPESPNYGKPMSYRMSSAQRQLDIHPSRVVRFVGREHPDPELASGPNQGWGDSVLQAVLDEVKRSDATSANIASLVFEAKVDVLKIPNLMASLADPDYEQQLQHRLGLAAQLKGINGMLVMDAQEDYEQKSASFAQLPEVLMSFLQLASGAADIPMTRLFGQSPGGLNASGDSDLRNYYDRVRSEQELTIQPALAVLDECLIRSALGARDPSVFYNWRSLWQTTDKERSEIGKATADTIKTVADTNLLPDTVMSRLAQNLLIENGVGPGLEDAMAEWEEDNPDRDQGGPSEDDLAAAGVDPAAEQGEGAQVGDAAPRTLYVHRKVENAAEILAWARAQGMTDLRTDLHVTVVYSSAAFDWIKAGNASEFSGRKDDKVVIAEGGPRAVEPLGGMSAVLLFASTQLSYRHEEIVRAGASHDFPDYTPHISLTKAPVDLPSVVPYRGPIVLGPEIFDEVRED